MLLCLVFVLSAWMLTSHTLQYCINCDLFIIIIIIMSISIINSQYSYTVLGLFYSQSKQILNWQCVIGFEVLTTVAMKNTVFQVIMACSWVGVHQRFIAMFCLHLQDWSISQARSRWQVFIFGLLLDPGNEADMLLRNVGGLLPDCMVLKPRRGYTWQHFVYK